MSDSPAMSPRELPARLREWMGDGMLGELAALGGPRSAHPEMDLDDMHFGLGVAVRNWLRRKTTGWSDLELDSRWAELVERAVALWWVDNGEGEAPGLRGKDMEPRMDADGSRLQEVKV